MLDDKTAIVFSAHRGTKKENIGDMLGAVALSKISGLPNAKLFCLPIDEGRSANVPVIYGGGGMIRPLFYDKINQDFRLRDKTPGYIQGQFHNKYTSKEVEAEHEKRNPLRRLGRPSDVARAALFYIADYDGYISGTTLDICGADYMC